MRYLFGDYELDAGRAELRCNGQQIPIEPQVFDLLKLLVSARDRIVSREEIFEKIWGNRIVSDAALSSRIRDARKAVGDDGTAQSVIRTIQRRGLRFVAEAEVVSAPSGAGDALPVETLGRDGNDYASIAVLPFSELTEGADDHLADGLADEVSAALAAWRYFGVVAPGSAVQFRGNDHALSEIGAALQARYLLTGAIRRSDRRIKVQVALTDADTGCQIWTNRIVRNMADLMDVEEEIAAQIASVITPELEGAEMRRAMRKPVEILSAWELVVRSSWLINKREKTDFAEAEDMAARAADLAPGWVLPYTLIAMARFQQAMTCFSGADSSTAFTRTLEAADMALEIDRGSWLAHALSAVGQLWTNRNHERATLHVDRAIELNPSASMNYHFGGCISGFSGQPDQARKYQEKLLRMDPVYPYRAVIEADLGLWHMMDKQFPEADNRLTRAQTWDPQYGRALQRRIALCGLTDDRAGASDAARQLSDLGYSLDPETISASYPFFSSDHQDLFLQGLRRAGVSQ
ncbi:winged helix-turn-helix domain-containing protein [Primorskyibacter sp. S87]|uniref:winged helix-turn-helix domain-containing protein n=1 Tax=Primorskyibacter sp. S87 TaxID=3415126 RepID=UPI003C7ABC8F